MRKDFGDVGAVVVASSFGRAVPGVVLDAGQNALGTDGFALKSAHLRSRHGRTQIRIFARAFHDASPARIARNIDHRSKGPLNAGGPGIQRSLMLCCLFHRRIP